MLRHFLLGKIHRATVTRADVDYVGSITLDPLLIEAAGFLENEKVDIYDVTNGSRLATYVIPGTPGSGEVGINGAAAHLVQKGDLVIIAAYGWMTQEESEALAPGWSSWTTGTASPSSAASSAPPSACRLSRTEYALTQSCRSPKTKSEADGPQPANFTICRRSCRGPGQHQGILSFPHRPAPWLSDHDPGEWNDRAGPT